MIQRACFLPIGEFSSRIKEMASPCWVQKMNLLLGGVRLMLVLLRPIAPSCSKLELGRGGYLLSKEMLPVRGSRVKHWRKLDLECLSGVICWVVGPPIFEEV